MVYAGPVDTFLAIASKRDARRYADTPIDDEAVVRILQAGRVSGSARNRQLWSFVIAETATSREALAACVYAPDNVRDATLVVAVATPGGRASLDVGRATQNMMLAAWNDGIVSTLNGMPDADAAARALELDSDVSPVSVVTFAYPATARALEARTADEWAAQANRKPLEEIVTRV